MRRECDEREKREKREICLSLFSVSRFFLSPRVVVLSFFYAERNEREREVRFSFFSIVVAKVKTFFSFYPFSSSKTQLSLAKKKKKKKRASEAKKREEGNDERN